MVFDATQAGKDRHEPLIQAFATMTEELKPELTVEEFQAMEFHLYYLKINLSSECIDSQGSRVANAV